MHVAWTTNTATQYIIVGSVEQGVSGADAWQGGPRGAGPGRRVSSSPPAPGGPGRARGDCDCRGRCRHGTHAAGSNRFSPGAAPEVLLQTQFPTPHLPGNARPNGKSAVISESGQEIVLRAKRRWEHSCCWLAQPPQMTAGRPQLRGGVEMRGFGAAESLRWLSKEGSQHPGRRLGRKQHFLTTRVACC